MPGSTIIKNQPFALAICSGCGPKKPYMKSCGGRMWLGGAREHYASEISDRKLPPKESLVFAHIKARS